MSTRGRFVSEFEWLRAGLEYAASIVMLDSIIGISVGNEDLYEKKKLPEVLAKMIEKVQESIKTWFPNAPCIPVGHTDTYQKVLSDANSVVGIFQHRWIQVADRYDR
jgi:exo-beta-1,3-glucanase (GH17 family)